MLNATSKETQLDDEPVGLPPLGKHVLACTVRKTPFPTDATFAAFRKAYKPFSALGEKDREAAVAGYIMSGENFPPEVLAELMAQGHEQQYTRSTWVEMYLIDPELREKGQQVHKATGWVCDAMPVDDHFDLVPTHWADVIPALEL